MEEIVFGVIVTFNRKGLLLQNIKAQESQLKKLDKIIDTMTKAIEPIMLIVIGGIVLVLALALYLPLFQSYEI